MPELVWPIGDISVEGAHCSGRHSEIDEGKIKLLVYAIALKVSIEMFCLMKEQTIYSWSLRSQAMENGLFITMWAEKIIGVDKMSSGKASKSEHPLEQGDAIDLVGRLIPMSTGSSYRNKVIPSHRNAL